MIRPNRRRVSTKGFDILCFCQEGKGHAGTAATQLRNVLVGKVPYSALGKESEYVLEVDGKRIRLLLRGYGEEAKSRPLRTEHIRDSRWIVSPIPVEDKRAERIIKNPDLLAALRHAKREGRVIDDGWIYGDGEEVKRRILNTQA